MSGTVPPIPPPLGSNPSNTALRIKFNAFKTLEGEKVNGTFTRLKCLLNDLENKGVTISQAKDSDSNVKEDTRSSSEFLVDLNVEFHDRALLANQKRFYKRSGRVGKYKGLKAETTILTKKIDAMSNGKSEKGLVAESFDWDKESVSSEDEGVTKVKAFMAITEDEPSVGKVDARSSQKNLLSKFNSLNQQLSSCKSELSDLKNTKALNCSLQNEISRLNLENESIKDEISDLKKVIEKWTSSKVTLDQLLIVQVPGNIVRALRGRGKRKDAISQKEMLFTKTDESPSETALEITSDSESECDNHDPLPSLPKLSGAKPIGTSNDEIPLADLTLILAVPKKTKQVTNKVSLVNVAKKKTQLMSPSIPDPCPEKKADSFTVQLHLTLIEEVKGLKEQMKPHQTTLHLFHKQGVQNLPKSNKRPEHPKQAVVKKTLAKLKASSSQGSSSRMAYMIPKPFIDCKYCGFNNHHSNECEYYPGCDICGSIAHETVDCAKKPSPNNRKPRIANRQSTKPTKKYSKESGPKVVFRDNSSGNTEGYGSVNCNGITFTMVAYVNGLKHNLIGISQLCDANFKVLFTKTQGTIFNQNNEVVLITPRKDVYVIDKTSYNEESNACFFSKASNSVNWLWHKRLSYLNLKNIYKLAKQNLVARLPSLTFSKDKTCSTCEKGKHHRASFKTKRSFSFSRCLHLLHMDLFGPVKPQTISHNKYTLVIMENLNEVRVKELRCDNGTEFRNHKLE
ncbi:retrovirus-related pol polyprotein from transposon TNT 1-94 [Tanacetum coccineum]